MNQAAESLTEAKADQLLNGLIRSQSASSLWFLRNSGRLSVRDPSAGVLLQAIVRHGTRDAWQQAKALQEWRCQHIK